MAASARLGLFSTGARSWIWRLIAVTAASISGIVEQGVLVEFRLELVDEVDQPARAVDEGHPDLGLDLVRRGLGVGVADVSTFDAVPDGLLPARST